MVQKSAQKFSVRSFNGGVIVTGATATDVRKAFAATKCKRKRGNGASAQTKAALKLYDVVGRFFKSGGRFKKPYKRKLKK